MYNSEPLGLMYFHLSSQVKRRMSVIIKRLLYVTFHIMLFFSDFLYAAGTTTLVIPLMDTCPSDSQCIFKETGMRIFIVPLICDGKNLERT